MFKFDPEKQITITREAVARILDPYGLKDFTYEPTSKGLENTSLLIESGSSKYVLRVYKRDKKADADIKLELAFQDHLRAKGIPIPLIYKNTTGGELSIIEIDGVRWRAILMEYVEGTVGALYTTDLISQLSFLQAKMHLLGIDFARQNPSDSPLIDLRESYSHSLELEKYDVEIREFLERARTFSYSADPQLPSGYNHLDLDMGGNVIVREGTIKGIVDFDDLAYSPCVIDLGYTLWDVLFDGGEEEMRSYIENYQQTRPLSAAEREALPHCVLFRNYVIGATDLFLGINDEMPRILELEKEIPLLRL